MPKVGLLRSDLTAQQSETKGISINLVTPKDGAKHELLLNKLASVYF